MPHKTKKANTVLKNIKTLITDSHCVDIQGLFELVYAFRGQKSVFLFKYASKKCSEPFSLFGNFNILIDVADNFYLIFF